MPALRVVLASASPARALTLRHAGLDPEIVVSGVDEDGVSGTPAEQVTELAVRKGRAVAPRVGPDTLVIACDSMLEFAGETLGKPGTTAAVEALWRRLRGNRGLLHTGHYVAHAGREATAVGTTVVHFAEVSDAEIVAYAATGEPQRVAGGFAIDGRGGAFVTRIEGDHANVVGVSLPLLRDLVGGLGLVWSDLWV
ncbi:Maf family protein [Granulicoccus phenolivorans]|uniref:Maf family protein n=1 Tax=Granulicoccus phenolivorans TaxID=266854 RepID=UPI0003FAAF11|nr:Maf family protein [Granulicoccus phenolivorans]